jgi:DNA-binding FadR family transcriptional regulator
MDELSNTIARDLMARICRQEFRSGRDFPNEAELCLHYNVSRVVIREAKKRLQALGMVHCRKKTGTSVTPRLNWNFFNRDLSATYMEHSGRAQEYMDDYYELRLMIEPGLAARVAEHHACGLVSRLRELVGDMAAALAAADAEAWLRADSAFQIGLYQESGNMLVLPIANVMWPMFLRGVSAGAQDWPESLLEHEKVVQAIADHDAAQAHRLVHAIIARAHSRYRAVCEGGLQCP